MKTDPTVDVTALLLEWNKGSRTALNDLMPLVYRELRRLARRYWRSEDPSHSLEPTVLVHEAFIRMVDNNRVNWRNRAQFFGVAGQIIRRVLVDHGRARHRLKRGGYALRVTLSDNVRGAKGANLDLIALDDALRRLEQLDPQQSSIVELRFFGGLSIEETAEALKISPATVKRDWAMARAWLRREMSRL